MKISLADAVKVPIRRCIRAVHHNRLPGGYHLRPRIRHYAPSQVHPDDDSGCAGCLCGILNCPANDVLCCQGTATLRVII